MPAFVGLDLAWTARNETGVCVLRGDASTLALERLGCAVATPAGFADLCDSLGDDVVVAVDAPLVVHPERRAERDLAKVFGKYKASAYFANMPFLEKMNGTAGPKLAIELRKRGFQVVPSGLGRRGVGRTAIEVFPHPAHVVLFGLDERLKYKKGPVAQRRAQMVIYQGFLRTLLAVEMPSVLDSALVVAALDREATLARGRALKNLEDRLDALTCAYVAFHCWNHGPAGYRVFGSDEGGAIVTPLLVPATSGRARSSP
jgi:predicted RNase H-like nuclease